jgi:hypothetical protein
MDDDHHAALASMPPKARDTLRRMLIHDQADRDAISPEPMRYRDGGATIGPTSSTC